MKQNFICKYNILLNKMGKGVSQASQHWEWTQMANNWCWEILVNNIIAKESVENTEMNKI